MEIIVLRAVEKNEHQTKGGEWVSDYYCPQCNHKVDPTGEDVVKCTHCGSHVGID